MDAEQEHVLTTVEDQATRDIRLWFTDVIGTLKSVAIAPSELAGAFAEGIGFDGSAVEGFSRVHEADMLLRPDAATFAHLPAPGAGTQHAGSARLFCDVLLPDGSPCRTDPRFVLHRAVQRAADLGLTFYVHPEIEYFLFDGSWRPGDPPAPIDHGGYFDHLPGGVAADCRRETVEALEAVGIPVEFSHHEGAPGQNEIDLRYSDALTCADSIVTARTLIREVALQRGLLATFMPKPLAHHPGSGMHLHLSLFEGERNAFFAAGAQHQLSPTGRWFIAGLLHHAAEITAVTNQWVNSYKRLWGRDEAPGHICWGQNNRSTLLRVPAYKPHKGPSTRVEVRSPDSACNPYLALAVLLAAGLSGIEQRLDLPPEVEDDVWGMTDPERRALGIVPMPGSLSDAIRAMEDSELVAETLGEQVFDFFLRNKRAEWDEYRSQITQFEVDRLLRVL